jgi:GNAT superfamily N-acetyltransferase
MADVPEFQSGLRQAVQEKWALSVRFYDSQIAGQLAGGIIIDMLENEILWLAVAGVSRGKGIGRLLLQEAIDQLDPAGPVHVQTYDASVEAGAAAMALFLDMGFQDIRDIGENPAGLSTVIMERLPTH